MTQDGALGGRKTFHLGARAKFETKKSKIPVTLMFFLKITSYVSRRGTRRVKNVSPFECSAFVVKQFGATVARCARFCA